MKYEIYQITNIRECDYTFMRYEFAIEKANKKFSLNDYTKVYEGEVPEQLAAKSTFEILEKLFEKFNIDHPNDFTGRSMSVSDLVKLDDKLYYCDFAGWEEIK